MAFLGSLVGAGLGLVTGNIQNKQTAAAQQAQQNYTQGLSKDAGQQANAQELAAWLQMMQRYQQYIQTNPNPAQTWQGIQQPGQLGPQSGQLGGGNIPSSGSVGQPQQQAPQQGMGQMRQLQGQQQAPQMPQQPPQSLGQQFNPMQPQSPNMGLPLSYLQNYFANQGGPK